MNKDTEMNENNTTSLSDSQTDEQVVRGQTSTYLFFAKF